MTILSPPQPAVRPRFAAPGYASWQAAMKDAVRSAEELYGLLGLATERLPRHLEATEQFPLFVPRGYVARMRPGDPNDPLLRQVLPVAEETLAVSGYVPDPVDDLSAIRHACVLHKYRGRVLLVTTGTCAVHCRYCFRRNFPYENLPHKAADWQPALDEIARDPTLHEVILSGGDPLSLVDAAFAELVRQLSEIGQLRRLRIHTRLPIVIPERITDHFVELVRSARPRVIVVVHANHANELDAHVATALEKLADAGALLLNQAVLLAGVNDSIDAQAALCERLVDLRVIPYYLHQLDRVAGAAHFEVPIEKGRRIIEELRSRLPGYAVPRYVQEIPGSDSKTILM